MFHIASDLDKSKDTVVICEGYAIARSIAESTSLRGNHEFVKTWRLTSNGLEGGQTVRAIDIYAEIENGYGIFNDIHNFSGGSELSNWLKHQTNLYYGVPMYEYTKEIAKSDNIEKLKEIYGIQREKLYSDFSLRSADGQVQRVADLFAGHITAGIFASSDYLEILTHNSTAIEEDVTKVFAKWLANRGSVKSHEEEQVINHVQEFLEQNDNRLAHVQNGNMIEANRPGFYTESI